jgi:hypothetical protein
MKHASLAQLKAGLQEGRDILTVEFIDYYIFPQPPHPRGGSRIFRTLVKNFVAEHWRRGYF